MKKCPHCGGDIQDEATKCKHCRRMIGEGATDTREPTAEDLRKRKKVRNRILGLSFTALVGVFLVAKGVMPVPSAALVCLLILPLLWALGQWVNPERRQYWRDHQEETMRRMQEASQGLGGLHPKARESLEANLGPGEKVQVVITGASRGQAMVGTNTRVFVFKKGFLAGQMLGSNVTSWDYRNLNGVQIEKHLMSGVVILQAPGVAAVDRSYWTTMNKDADQWKVPNAIPIVSAGFAQAEAGVAKLRELIAAAHAPEAKGSVMPVAAPDEADQIRKLAALRDEGIISSEEFEAKKKELLGRL